MQALAARLLPIALCLAGCARERQSELPPPASTARAAQKPATGTGCSDEELSHASRRVLRGLATYYHDSLEGNPTASGALYDPESLSAAHRSLPFGTRLRVTRTDVSVSPVCVTVNDRGPYGGRRRVLDVSRRAADALGMLRAGVVPVRIDVL